MCIYVNITTDVVDRDLLIDSIQRLVETKIDFWWKLKKGSGFKVPETKDLLDLSVLHVARTALTLVKDSPSPLPKSTPKAKDFCMQANAKDFS